MAKTSQAKNSPHIFLKPLLLTTVKDRFIFSRLDNPTRNTIKKKESMAKTSHAKNSP